MPDLASGLPRGASLAGAPTSRVDHEGARSVIRENQSGVVPDESRNARRTRRPRCPREGDLTKIRYFHRVGNMKTIARLPLAQLSADETHVEAFRALAHLSRLQVFFLLVKAGREMSVGEIQEALEIPGPTLSHHLDILRRAGLVENRKEERYIYYSVQRERVTALVRLLTACC